MLKRIKIWMMAVAALLFATLLPSIPVFAAELSGETVEVPEDGKKHTVVAFGGSIAMLYPDGKMNIIANNPSGRIDVMIDGEVVKGIGLITIPAQNQTNMVLEAGSYLLSGISEQQADALKKAVADSLKTDVPVLDLSAIEGQEGMQGANAFIVGQWGKLQTADGAEIPDGALSGIQVTTPEAAYQEFAEEMEESIRREQEAARKEQETAQEEQNIENNSSNGVTNACSHNWELYESTSVVLLADGCATPPFYRCTICKRLMWLSQNMHKHTEGQKCEYCGRNGVCGEDLHNFVEKQFENPILLRDYSGCYTGTIYQCTKCSMLDPTKGDLHIHGDDFCEYCGYNKSGKQKE